MIAQANVTATPRTFRTIIEPFRIHAVEPLRMTTPGRARRRHTQRRLQRLQPRGADVLIDLLTDSGTGAMSRDQWAAIQHGDESYAGSPSWFIFRDAVTELFPFRHVIPTHQGRAAEQILFSVDRRPRQGRAEQHPLRHDAGQRRVHRRRGGRPRHRRGPRPGEPAPVQGEPRHRRARRAASQARGREHVPVVMVTITNNSAGGQPVSLANLHEVRAVCDQYASPAVPRRLPLRRERLVHPRARGGPAGRDVADIVREMASLADGMTMSAKKDPLVQHRRLARVQRRRSRRVVPEHADPHRRLPHLRRARRAATSRPSRRGSARPSHTTTCVTGSSRRHTWARPCITAASRSSCRSVAMPSTSTPGALLPHIPPLQYPGQSLAVALYQTGASAAARSGR